MVFNEYLLKDAPAIAGMIVTRNYHDALSATIVDLFRRNYLAVKRIPPSEKNIANKYYHNYEYSVTNKLWSDLMDFEKMLLELLKKYKGGSLITQEELEEKSKNDAEFKGFYNRWVNSLKNEMEAKGLFKKFLGIFYSLTYEGKKHFKQWHEFKTELELLKINSLAYNDLIKWEQYLCYAISFGSLSYAETIHKLMDEMFKEEQKRVSNLFIMGINGNDAYFDDFNFFAPIDFGMTFSDFLIYMSK